MNLTMIHRWQVDPLDVTVDSEHRLDAGRQVQIGGALLHAEGQQLRNIHPSRSLMLWSDWFGVTLSAIPPLPQR